MNALLEQERLENNLQAREVLILFSMAKKGSVVSSWNTEVPALCDQASTAKPKWTQMTDDLSTEGSNKAGPTVYIAFLGLQKSEKVIKYCKE